MRSGDTGKKVIAKVEASTGRLVYFFRAFPVRMIRLWKHLLTGIRAIFNSQPKEIEHSQKKHGLSGFLQWWICLVLLISDCFGFPEFYESVMDWFKFNTRPLDAHERRLAEEIFPGVMLHSRIRIDQRAFLGPRQWQIAYVSYYTINSYGKINPATLIHELVHIWQFEKYGSRYIIEALAAQRRHPSYDYGGATALHQSWHMKKPLTSFNFEQQAEIIEDMYRLEHGMPPGWGDATHEMIWLYKHYHNDLLKV